MSVGPAAPSPERISWRNSRQDDFPFLFALHAATMKEYVDQTWGWDDAAQERRYRETFAPGDTRIITLDGQDIGMLAIEESEAEVFLALIEVDPRHQHRGIGTTIIGRVLTDCAQRRKPIFLHVLKVNPARKLYERLGFSVVEETPTHFHMKRTFPEQGSHRD